MVEEGGLEPIFDDHEEADAGDESSGQGYVAELDLSKVAHLLTGSGMLGSEKKSVEADDGVEILDGSVFGPVLSTAPSPTGSPPVSVPTRKSKDKYTALGIRDQLPRDEDGVEIPLDDCIQLLSPALRSALYQYGWRKDFILHSAIDEYSDVQELVKQVMGGGRMDSFYNSYSRELWVWYGEMGDRIRRGKQRRMNPPLDVKESERMRHTLPAEEPLLEIAVKRLCHPKPLISRSRFSRNLNSLTDESQRETMKREERERWLERLAMVIKEARTPVAFLAESTSNPLATIKLAFGSRRHRTLRARYRVWCKIRLWLVCVHGVHWPRGVGDMLDYLSDCGRYMGKSWPNEVAATLAMMEKVAGFKKESCISDTSIWKGAVSSINLELQSIRSGDQPAVKKAPQLPILHIIALELEVANTNQRMYFRLHCFIRLVKVWAALRTDDVFGICPRRLNLMSRVLRGILVETKTTGPGKRVKEVAFFVARDCRLVDQSDWMEIGMQLVDMLPQDREVFFPHPNRTWDGAINRAMTYSDMSALSRMVSASLKMPIRVKGRWESSTTELMPGPTSFYWTEHSERHVLVAIGAALGEPKSSLDMVGRWGINMAQSHDYLHTSRHVVTSIQKKIIRALRSGPCNYDEDDLQNGIVDFLIGKGLMRAVAVDYAARSIAGLDENVGLGMDSVSGNPEGVESSGFEKDTDQEPPKNLDAEMDDRSLEDLEAEGPIQLPQDGQLWMTISRSGFRCLHKGGVRRCVVDPLRVHRWEICEPGCQKADKPCSFCFDTKEIESDDSSDSSEDISSSEDP